MAHCTYSHAPDTGMGPGGCTRLVAAWVAGIAFSSDRTLLTTASEDQAARLWDGATNVCRCAPHRRTGVVRGWRSARTGPSWQPPARPRGCGPDLADLCRSSTRLGGARRLTPRQTAGQHPNSYFERDRITPGRRVSPSAARSASATCACAGSRAAPAACSTAAFAAIRTAHLNVFLAGHCCLTHVRHSL